jgi:DNA-binding MarR family transcriptional regulator
MTMIEPDPLMYVQKDLHTELHADLIKFLSKRPEGYKINEITKHSKISRPQFFNIIKPLREQGLIEKYKSDDNKTMIYKLKKDKK